MLWRVRSVCIGNLHNHLLAAEERVADELARAQSNLRVGHLDERIEGTGTGCAES